MFEWNITTHNTYTHISPQSYNESLRDLTSNETNKIHALVGHQSARSRSMSCLATHAMFRDLYANIDYKHHPREFVMIRLA